MIMIVMMMIIIICNKAIPLPKSVLRVSVFGVQATGWNVRGSNPGKGRDFQHPSAPAVWPTQPSVQLVSCLFRWVKAART
jgi:hypothetical protein